MNGYRIRRLVVALIALTAVAIGRIPSAQAQVGTVKPVEFPETRGMRYCEIFLAKPEGILMYNTSGLNDCPAAWWKSLDRAKIGKEYGAREVIMNGPHFWMADKMTIALGEALTFEGQQARYVGTLPPAMEGKGPPHFEPYKVFDPKKAGSFTYLKDKQV